MKYTVQYLTRQLAEASKVSAELNARLAADPDDIVLFLSARSMNDHIQEILLDFENAKAEERFGVASYAAQEGCLTNRP
jgi:hypothetical protein